MNQRDRRAALAERRQRLRDAVAEAVAERLRQARLPQHDRVPPVVDDALLDEIMPLPA